MTGIAPYSSNITDFPDGRYSKNKMTAERFRIIQLGICTWKKIPSIGMDDKPVFLSKPYNIYVFPEEDSGPGSGLINCETAAIIFNRDHGMDFNKWIYKGVHYINSKQLKTMTDSATEWNINFYDPSDKTKFKNIMLYKDEDKLKYEDFCKTFSEFLYSEHKTYIFEKYQRFFINYILNNLQENIRKRLYFSYETIEGKTFLMIKKVEENERQALLDAELGKKLEEVNKKKGVKKIFDALVKKKSVLVGHNFALDLLFTMSHFGEQLPATLKEWKTLLKDCFREIFDTKYIYEQFYDQFINQGGVEKDISYLEYVYTTLRDLYKDSVSIQIPDGMPDYTQAGGNYHQASYDAFVTGCSFIWMADNLKENLTKYSNRIYMMRSIYSCYNLDGDETYLYPNVIFKLFNIYFFRLCHIV
jgi:poly(A)-specific ribonuclease